uniref:Putative o-linked n-acetylglucosamine transferase ogt n=1 Tax=Xenopsylla cheopis TaxID=163159 RepID=A0A6M2DHR9_XENCH
MDDDELISTFLYYGREKLYHAMQQTALEGLSRFSSPNMYNLYNGMALVIGNRIQEGMKELLPLVKDKETSLAAHLALIEAHKKCSVIDKEALLNLESKLEEEKRGSSNLAMYHAALFLFYNGFIDKASDYIDRSLRLNSEFDKGHSLKGWILLNLSINDEGTRKHFDKSLSLNTSLDSHLGLVKLQIMRKEYEAAITALNKVIVKYPNSIIPLVEKMYVQLAKWDWDQSLETSLRILQTAKNNLQAHIVQVVVILCRDGNYDKASKAIKELSLLMENSESKNTTIFVECAQLFSRICGRNQQILNETYRLVEYGIQMNSTNADITIELGYQYLMREKVNKAMQIFQSATKLDNSSIEALCGLTFCQLLQNGATDQIGQQIEFLMEIHGNDNIISLLNYMSAKLVKNDTDSVLSLLNKSYETHCKTFFNLPYGVDYLNKLNPDFLLQLVKEYLTLSPTNAILKNEFTQPADVHISLKQAKKILLAIVQACPGLVEGMHQLAYVYYLSGDIFEANNTLQKILDDLDPTFADAHLLKAQICIQQNSYHKAAQSLEVCLSYNFNVRENSLYHLIMGIVQKEENHVTDALKSFEKALELANNKASKALSAQDKVTLYLELVDAYVASDRDMEAAKILQDAMDEFQNTPESGRILIANADLAIKTGDVQEALSLLGKIYSGHSYYLQAKTKMASIYLHQLKDRQAFAHCFRELVENSPGPDSYVMLGDAYMSIQEPDHAIEAYDQAITQNPKDSTLASKMGRALVKTHQYSRAVEYYKEAVVTCQNPNLKLDMSELYCKLKQFENAEKILLKELEDSKDIIDDINVMQMKTKQLLLLSRVKEKSGNLTESIVFLNEAKENQIKVIKRISLDGNASLIAEQQRISSQVCILMAEQYSRLRESTQAIEQYKDALKFQPNNSEILSALARVYMQINNFDMCEETCGIVLQIEPNHEAVSVMMADLAFRKVDFEGACFHFSQLLLAQPLYWTALARLIEVMRRIARLSEAVPFIERAEKACKRSGNDSDGFYPSVS